MSETLISTKGLSVWFQIGKGLFDKQNLKAVTGLLMQVVTTNHGHGSAVLFGD